jgi:hypothetical protein
MWNLDAMLSMSPIKIDQVLVELEGRTASERTLKC